MTKTYPDDVPDMKKIAEELRLIRCCLERMLSARYPSYFVDYEHEKFGPDFKMDNG